MTLRGKTLRPEMSILSLLLSASTLLADMMFLMSDFPFCTTRFNLLKMIILIHHFCITAGFQYTSNQYWRNQ